MLIIFTPNLCSPIITKGAEQSVNSIQPKHEVERIFGQTRFDTMLEIALKFNPGKSQNVILATGHNFPDALAGVPLARQKNAPILLVDATPELSSKAFSYIKEHVDKKGYVYILGGNVVIPETFVSALVELGFDQVNIHRLGGLDRYDTAVEVAKQLQHDGREFYIASGDTFSDALSASVVAATENYVSTEKASYYKSIRQEIKDSIGGVPILLVPSNKPVPESVTNYLNSFNLTEEQKQKINIIGGTAVVPESSVKQLNEVVKKIASNGITRLAGLERYDTMAIVNNQAEVLEASNIYLASGENFPDALTGAVLAAKDCSPLVLVNDTMPKGSSELLQGFFNKNQEEPLKNTKITALGGEAAISNQTITYVDYIFNFGGSIKDKGNVTTLAGSGKLGYKDGKAFEAEFAFPAGIAEGKDGTVYISDSKNHVIRALLPDGNVTTVAGKAQGIDQYGLKVGGFNDGFALEAMFNQPKGLALDSNDNLYVVDSGNGAIRVVDRSGNVKTLIKGLNFPSDVVFAPDGELFVTETLNHRIMKITENGIMSVLAGGEYETDAGIVKGGYADGVGEKAKFNEPSGLVMGPDGTLYVADTGNQRIRAISASGSVTTVAGSGSDLMAGTNYISGGFKNGMSSSAQFNFSSSIAVTADQTVYVADTYNHLIRVISKDGQVKTLAGRGNYGKQNGFLVQAEFDGPSYIRLSKKGSLLIVDQLSNLLREINLGD